MTNQIDITSITPEQLAEMQAKAKAALPTVPTEPELREFQRRMDAENARREREEKAKKEREAQQARLLTVANKVVAALREKRPDRVFEANLHEFGNAYVREVRKSGYSLLPDITVAWEEQSGSRYSFRSYTGKTRITLGGIGNRKSYPQRKDGTHSYDKIAEEALFTMLDEERRRSVAKSMEDTKNANKEAAAALRKKLGANEWYDLDNITPNIEQLFITFQAFVADESQAFQMARIDHMMGLEEVNGRYYVLAERYDVLRAYQAR